MAELYSIVYIYHIFSIHSPIEGHPGSFQILDIINRAALDIVCILISCWGILCVYAQEWYSGVLWKYYSQFFEEPPD